MKKTRGFASYVMASEKKRIEIIEVKSGGTRIVKVPWLNQLTTKAHS